MAHPHVLGRREASPSVAADSAAKITRDVFRDLFGPPARRTFDLKLWDGTLERGGAHPPAFTLVLKHPGTMRKMLLPPSELAVGEAYLHDDFDVEGSMEAAAGLADMAMERTRSPLVLARVMRRLSSLPADDLSHRNEESRRAAPHLTGRLHSRKRDAGAVRYHYDVGNDFYALWLDSRMVYSCAYFHTGAEDIDAAQSAKLEHICRKLRLKPGESLLDIGCGWGALVMYAAELYGVNATGITLSEPQAELARKRIEAAGLSDRCRVEVRDYRDLPHEAAFDKVVSIGMVEHVGRAKLPTYFKEAYRLTKPGGLFLNHGIVMLEQKPRPGSPEWAGRILWREGAFSQRYVFPDGELLTPGEMVQFGERAGFETRDLESLREHYALTLRHWIRRLEAHHDEVRRTAGEETYRVWRLYMSAAARGFATGRAGIIQTLLSRQMRDGVSAMPLTREDIYS